MTIACLATLGVYNTSRSEINLNWWSEMCKLGKMK